MRDLEDMVGPLLDVCEQAAEVICGHYNAPGADLFESKGDDSPLTRADLDSHDILCRGLHSLEPGIPLLSEESPPQDKTRRRAWSDYWLVDPLDGTKEFLARTGEFTVNIALVSDHRPILGLLYLPLERLGYVGIPGVGAGCYRRRENQDWVARPLGTRSLVAGRPLTLLASRRHQGPRLLDCLQWLERNWGQVERLDSGSALKFCQLADGRGDIYPRFSPCCEWDTGAGQAVLEGAGGCLLGLDGEPLRYNTSESLYSPDFYALADGANELWSQLLRRDSH